MRRRPVLRPVLRPLLALAAAAGLLATGAAPPGAGSAAAAAADAAPTATTVVGGLDQPAAFAVAPDGSVLYAELLGGVVLRHRAGTTTTVLRVPGQRQALGMTLSPTFARDGLVYLYGARSTPRGLRLQLVRFTASGGGFTVLRDLGPWPPDHRGGPLRFGPDGRLYLSVGDLDRPASAQDPASPGGKVLRMTRSGGPVDGTRVFARGLRNAFGLAFDPRTGRLWATDNGPECNDELNQVRRGANYGWGPSAACTGQAGIAGTNRDGASPVLPASWSATSVSPTGAAFCVGCGLGAATEGTLLHGTYVTRELRRATLTADRTGIARDELLLANPDPVLSLVRAPGGAVWFSDTRRIARLG